MPIEYSEQYPHQGQEEDTQNSCRTPVSPSVVYIASPTNIGSGIGGYVHSPNCDSGEHQETISYSFSRESLSFNEDSSEDDLPFPGFMPITCGFLTQNSKFRFFCLTAVQNPYPFYAI